MQWVQWSALGYRGMEGSPHLGTSLPAESPPYPPSPAPPLVLPVGLHGNEGGDAYNRIPRGICVRWGAGKTLSCADTSLTPDLLHPPYPPRPAQPCGVVPGQGVRGGWYGAGSPPRTPSAVRVPASRHSARQLRPSVPVWDRRRRGGEAGWKRGGGRLYVTPNPGARCAAPSSIPSLVPNVPPQPPAGPNVPPPPFTPPVPAALGAALPQRSGGRRAWGGPRGAGGAPRGPAAAAAAPPASSARGAAGAPRPPPHFQARTHRPPKPPTRCLPPPHAERELLGRKCFPACPAARPPPPPAPAPPR